MMQLRGDAFTAVEKARNFCSYEALTVRHSSLSACAQAVLAAETGYLDLAYDYLTEAALMDLDDLEHNITFAFTPRLPSGLTRLMINLRVRARRLRVEITPGSTTYRLQVGDPLRLLHAGAPVT